MSFLGLGSPFSSTPKWLAIEWEDSEIATLRFTQFNQPWDVLGNQLKQHQLHLHRCHLLLHAPQRQNTTHRENQSCPHSNVGQPPQSDTNLCFSCLCPGVKTDRANNSEWGHLTEGTSPEVFFELLHSMTMIETTHTGNHTRCILNLFPVMWPWLWCQSSDVLRSWSLLRTPYIATVLKWL